MTKKIEEYFGGDYRSFFEDNLIDVKHFHDDEYKARCPFQDDGSRSFSFNPKKGVYHCHKCGEGGDFIQFYGKLMGLDHRSHDKEILRGIAHNPFNSHHQHRVLSDSA